MLQFTASAHAGMDGPFTVLSYREPADTDVVYRKNTGATFCVEKADMTVGTTRSSATCGLRR